MKNNLSTEKHFMLTRNLSTEKHFMLIVLNDYTIQQWFVLYSSYNRPYKTEYKVSSFSCIYKKTGK